MKCAAELASVPNVISRKPAPNAKFFRKSQNSVRPWPVADRQKSPGFQNCFQSKRRHAAVAGEHEGAGAVRYSGDDAERHEHFDAKPGHDQSGRHRPVRRHFAGLRDRPLEVEELVERAEGQEQQDQADPDRQRHNDAKADHEVVSCPGSSAIFTSHSVQRAQPRSESVSPGILREGKSTVNDEHYDAIIIGSGPGGGTMAWRLAQTGKRILLLERGDYLPRERENWDTQAVFMDARYQTDELWYGSDGSSFHPGLHYFVGGNSKVYGAVLLRLRERDFDEIRHPDGISPGWPLKYDAFEPYYQAAEELYHVHGLRGEDPTEPPSRLPYAFPPLTHEPRIQQLFDGLKREGHHPFHLPVGILLDEEGGKALPHSPCIRCNAFDGYPCLTNGKADSQIICVDPALKAHANLTLRTRSYVTRLTTDSKGARVSGVEIVRDGVTTTASADIVVVACGALSSALLMLRSATMITPMALPMLRGWSAATTCGTTTPRSLRSRARRIRPGSRKPWA